MTINGRYSLWLRDMISESILSVFRAFMRSIPKFLRIECQTDAGLPACNLGTLRPRVSPPFLLKDVNHILFKILGFSCWAAAGKISGHEAVTIVTVHLVKMVKNYLLYIEPNSFGHSILTATLLSNFAVTAQRTHRFIFSTTKDSQS